MTNRHGLPRNIPSKVKREVRRRSKFGCVMCRAGIFEYEHIEPEYKDAKTHDPDGICCLCSQCHAKVTRKQLSKSTILIEYKRVAGAGPNEIKPPFEKLDFNQGTAQLIIGGLVYAPNVENIFRYHGESIISITPSTDLSGMGINALFTDEGGNKTLSIADNEWQGALEAWDTEVKGPRIMVRQKRGKYSLIIRMEPPGRIVIEKLGMRFKDAHILASEEAYAVGRYVSTNKIHWLYAEMINIDVPLSRASAIEFVTPLEAECRDVQWNGLGKRLSNSCGTVFQTGLGVTHKPLGIIIGSNCLRFEIARFALGGPRPLSKIRRAVFCNGGDVWKSIGQRKT